MSQETPGVEQRGVEIVPKDERTFGFLDLWLGTILGSEQGIAGTVAMRSAFGINGRYREISAP
jgi:hypothetical protein